MGRVRDVSLAKRRISAGFEALALVCGCQHRSSSCRTLLCGVLTACNVDFNSGNSAQSIPEAIKPSSEPELLPGR